MRTDDFSFDLPADLIAHNPVSPRDSSRLMTLDRLDGTIQEKFFSNLDKLLKKGDVLVFNKSKVIPARINFIINGVEHEILLIRKLDLDQWKVMVRPGKRFKKHSIFEISDGVKVVVVGIDENGLRDVKFSIGGNELEEFIKSVGKPPYPPYIKNTKASFADYQTVYAEDEGSVAAPTAGLHFTKELIDKLLEKGVQIEYVTLHIGPGTFLPVKTDTILEHKMHSEYYEMSSATASALNVAKKEGKRIIAVGTTSVRVLESNFNEGFTAECKDTDIFIYPGYQWKCVDGLLTNFHLPKSTLLMLVASFAGHELILRAYKEAVDNKYRFYSFGDAMLIL